MGRYEGKGVINGCVLVKVLRGRAVPIVHIPINTFSAHPIPPQPRELLLESLPYSLTLDLPFCANSLIILSDRVSPWLRRYTTALSSVIYQHSDTCMPYIQYRQAIFSNRL